MGNNTISLIINCFHKDTQLFTDMRPNFLIPLFVLCLPAFAASSTDNNWDPVTIITVAAALLAILTVIMGGLRSIAGKERIKTLETRQSEMDDQLKKLAIADIDTIKSLEAQYQKLTETVNDTLKQKVDSLSDTYGKLETKVNDLSRYFDETNKDRKEEDKAIKHEITLLRENIRKDINDVKNIIINLMLSLKNDDNQ